MADMKANVANVRDLVWSYGAPGEQREGILAEHLRLALEAGLVERKLGNSTWLVEPNGKAHPVLCSELIRLPSWEDPDVVVGRCGALATSRLYMCEGHTVAAAGTPDPDPEATCEHGMAAWLCAGPMHYPADVREDYR